MLFEFLQYHCYQLYDPLSIGSIGEHLKLLECNIVDKVTLLFVIFNLLPNEVLLSAMFEL